MAKKSAFLILAHEDQPLLELLTNHLLGFGDVYIHLDTKSSINTDFLSPRPGLFVYKELSILWGDWSMVLAVRFLAERAIANGATYLHSLSGITLPVCSHESFRHFVDAELDYFEANQITDEEFAKRNRHFQMRFTHRYKVLKMKRNVIGRLARRTMREIYGFTPKLDYKKALGEITLCHGIGFWSVRSDTYTEAMEVADNHPEVIRYFSSTEISDESFFQTLFAHVSEPASNSARTYVDWIGNGTPAFITLAHLEKLKNSPEFIFARKFSSQDSEVISSLREIWNKS